MKRIFIVGATGYIGSVVAEKFLARGDIVLGLTRSDQKAAILQTRGIKPARGSMEGVHTLLEYAQTADATILATEAQTGDSHVVEQTGTRWRPIQCLGARTERATVARQRRVNSRDDLAD